VRRGSGRTRWEERDRSGKGWSTSAAFLRTLIKAVYPLLAAKERVEVFAGSEATLWEDNSVGSFASALVVDSI